MTKLFDLLHRGYSDDGRIVPNCSGPTLVERDLPGKEEVAMYQHTRRIGTFAATGFLALVACGPTRAGTFTFSAPSNFDSSTNTLNFGSLAIGSTLEVVVTATGALTPGGAPPGDYVLAPAWSFPGGSNLLAPFSYVAEGNPVPPSTNGCFTSNLTCNIDYFFTPISTGLFTTTQEVFFQTSFGGFGETITLEGTGVAATPIPAALPLFATGLGGLGLLGWRRKRKARAV